MTSTFSPVLLVALVGTLFVFGTLLISFLLRPYAPDQNKSEIYECGEHPIGQAWVNSNIRFYILALIFLIFEVELAVMFPVGVAFRKWAMGVDGLSGGKALIAVMIFAVTLFLGVIYSWVKGDLEWVKLINKTRYVGDQANAVPSNLKENIKS